MPATTFSTKVGMTNAVGEAENSSLITAAETNQLKTGPGKCARLIVSAVGTTATVDIYDATSGTSNPIYRWLTADGKVSITLLTPFFNGLRVITGGTVGEVRINWS